MKVITINKTAYTQDEFKDKVRDAILDALDSVSPTGKGWKDEDLTALFKSVDNHSDKLFYRLGAQIASAETEI